jgi:hypothetical protein
MQNEEPPIVRCPGCHQPLEAKERTPVTERLVVQGNSCAQPSNRGNSTEAIVKARCNDSDILMPSRKLTDFTLLLGLNA